MPEATLNAITDHGQIPDDSIHGTYDQSQAVLDDLAALGIDHADVLQVLEDQGVTTFDASWDHLGQRLAFHPCWARTSGSSTGRTRCTSRRPPRRPCSAATPSGPASPPTWLGSPTPPYRSIRSPPRTTGDPRDNWNGHSSRSRQELKKRRPMMGTDVRVRRVYDEPSPEDGARVLVDRVWPRGMRKEAARLDERAKDAAPSAELRTWYHHDPAKFDEFRRRYTAELAQPGPKEALARLRALAADRPVTLLTATKDLNLSQAAVLAGLLRETT